MKFLGLALLAAIALGNWGTLIGAEPRVWQIGVDANPAITPYSPFQEFGTQNNINDRPPGVVTRLPGDPLYNSASNPIADDDYYFSGTYPSGFNGLTTGLSVPNSEPTIAWERAQTIGDRTNRMHFIMDAADVAPGSRLRLTVEFSTGSWLINGVVQPGFGDNDMVIRFRNGAGTGTVLYTSRISNPTNIVLDFSTSSVAATSGPNTIEVVRTGPLTSGYSYGILYDFIRLETVPNLNLPPVAGPVSPQHCDELAPLGLTLTATDAATPASGLQFSRVSGPEGLTISNGGRVQWTPTGVTQSTTNTVVYSVTDAGSPPLSTTNEFLVVSWPVNPRSAWQIGIDHPPGTPTANTYLEFATQNNINDAKPGKVTRLPEDPQYSATANPLVDDDFYFEGLYPAGFNQLTGPLRVAFDEPAIAWERSHTLGDRTNRMHFRLNQAQISGGATLRLQFEFLWGGATIGGVLQPGFADHDFVVRFINGAGVASTLYSSRISQATNITLSVLASSVAATLGPNSIELIRTGPAVTGVSYFLTYDFVRLEGAAPANTAPTLNPVENQLLDEGQTLAMTLSATDADQPAQTLTFEQIEGPAGLTVSSTGELSWTTGETDGPSTNTVTIRVSDNGSPNLSTTTSFNVVVREVNTTPALAPVADWNLGLGQTLSLTLIATDPDQPAQNLTFDRIAGPTGLTVTPDGAVSWTPGIADSPSTNVVTVRVSDDGSPGLSATTSFAVVVSDSGPGPNSPPLLSAVENMVLDEGRTLALTLSASDTDQPLQTLTFERVEGPTGLLVSASGELSWSPGEADGPSTNVVTIRVSDNGSPSLSSTTSFSIVVREVNSAPTLTAVADQAIGGGQSLNLSLTATDDDQPAQGLTFQRIEGPTGLTVSPTGNLEWTPGAGGSSSTNVVTVQVSDNGTPNLTATTSFTIIVTISNSPPLLTGVDEQSLDEGQALSLTLSATDTDQPVQTLTFERVEGPTGLTVSSTGQLSWLPGEADGPSTNVVTVRVLDNGSPSLSATTSFTVVVREVNSTPTLTAVADPTIGVGQTLSLILSATDADQPAQGLTYERIGGPAGLTVSPTGELEWTPGAGDSSTTNIVTVRVSDSGSPSLSATTSFTVVVREVNSTPLLTGVDDQILDEGQTLALTLSASDTDQPLQTLSFERVEGPTGLTVSSTGQLTWSPGEADGPSTNVVTVRVSDSGLPSLSSTSSFTVVVREVNTPPILPPIPTQTVVAPASLALNLGAIDTDLPANPLTYGLQSGPIGLSVSPSGVVTWSPGNAQIPSTSTVEVWVTDNGLPPLASTNAFTVIASGTPARFVWMIGTNHPPGTPGVQTYSEFSGQNNTNDARPGVVTRLPGDPLYNAANIPRPDDDYYFKGDYPVGFNGLTTPLSVPNDEPWTSWEHSHTLGDRTNRVHFALTDSQTTSNSMLRLSFEFSVMGSTINGVVQPGFADHDMVVNFRNGAGLSTLLYSQRISAPTNIILTIPVAMVSATPGANSIEIIRNAPPYNGTSYYIVYDYLMLEADAGGNLAPMLIAPSDMEIDELTPLVLNLNTADTDTPRSQLIHQLVSGPAGMVISSAGQLAWTPNQTQGPSTNLVVFKVSDTGIPSLSATNQFTVIVRNVNSAPILPPLPFLGVDGLNPLSFTLQGWDSDTLANTLTYQLLDGPLGLTVSTAGVVHWMPTTAQVPSTNSFEVQITDDGIPPLSSTTAFTVVAQSPTERNVWILGMDDFPQNVPYTPTAEFSPQNNTNDPPAGRITRAGNDPQYVAGLNAPPDDDFYFAGIYRSGFNSLAYNLLAQTDEAFTGWEHALTTADSTNRLHFVLGAHQVSDTAHFRLSFELVSGYAVSNSVVLPTFSQHDLVVRFRSGLGQSSLLYSNRITKPTAVVLEIPATNIVATPGANSIEFVRVGPGAPGISNVVSLDFVRLEVDADANGDADGDGLRTAWERDHHLSDSDPGDASSDEDGDGLTALEEYHGGIQSSDPFNRDTDHDGLTDAEERAAGTNPTAEDTDGDGIRDVDEVQGFPRSSPLLTDTDGDTYSDLLERRVGTDPSNPARTPGVYRGGIGINFVSASDPEGRLGNNVLAGAVPQYYWNETGDLPTVGLPVGNISNILSPVAGSIVRSDGTSLPNMTITWTGANSAATQNHGTGDQVLMNGLLESTSAAPLTITVSNVPFARYDVFVIVGGWADGYRGRIRLGTDAATDRSFSTQSAPPQAEFIDAVSNGTTNHSANLIHYRDLTTPHFSLTLTKLSGAYLGAHAIQIVDAQLDADSSGLPDWWERRFALVSGGTSLAGQDTDGDGLTNLAEYQRASNPRIRDTDQDGLTDAQETAVNSTRPDSDADGVSDTLETTAVLPSSPNLADTDADGVSDRDETRFGSDPGYRETLSPTFKGWTPRYQATPAQWEWNLENVQIVWDHGAGGLYPDQTTENNLLTFSVRNNNNVDVLTFQMGLRYYRGLISYTIQSEAAGGFSGPGQPTAALRESPVGGRVGDLTADLGFSGYGPADVSDKLTFRLLALRGAANSWTVTFEIRNVTRNKSVVLRSFQNCTASALVDNGTAQWKNSAGLINRPNLDVNQGIRLFFSPTSLETRPQFALTRDSDDDGLPDSWESSHGTSFQSASDAQEDPDNDGLTNLQEHRHGTNPFDPDSDGDGIRDGAEVEYTSSPTDPTSRPQHVGTSWPTGMDLDGNGLPDAWEARYRAYNLPPAGDADGDGQSNGQEALWGTNPFDSNSRIALTFTPQSPDVVLSWPFEPMKRQTLFWKTGSDDWVEYTLPPLSSGGVSRVLLEDRLELNPAELYRVDTQDQDSDGDGVNDWTESVLGSNPKRVNSTRSPQPILTPGGLVVGSISGDYVNFVEQLRPSPPDSVHRMSRMQAARFLQQTTFGPTRRDLDQVQRLGFEGWIDDQVNNQPPSLYLPYIQGTISDYHGPRTDLSYHFDPFNQRTTSFNLTTSFARAAVSGPDQLRQRVAFALSQILVISRREPTLAWRPLSMASYYDIFIRNAFGNYYDILREVTFHPAMGQYLSHLGNQKAIPERNQFPDENYAREVQQLFSIGLWELNPDGTRKLNVAGQPIATYGNREITEFARVFTGMWFAGQAWGTGGEDRNMVVPLEMVPDKHDFGPKTLLNGFEIPARTPNAQNAVRDVEDALRNLFNHPNTGPFIGHQMIQFLVTSNPSSNYVARVASAFADNGTGQRGDLGAVVRAVLLDPEARDVRWLAGTPEFGRFKEPVYRAMNLARAGHLDRYPNLLWWTLGAFSKATLQEPTDSPTVFNFFRPDYQPPGLMAERGLVGPAFQIADSYSVISVPNKLWEICEQGLVNPGYYAFPPDYSELMALAGDSDALVDEVNLLFCGGLMSSTTRRIVLETVEQAAPFDRLLRTQLAVYMAVTCPEGAVQR